MRYRATATVMAGVFQLRILEIVLRTEKSINDEPNVSQHYEHRNGRWRFELTLGKSALSGEATGSVRVFRHDVACGMFRFFGVLAAKDGLVADLRSKGDAWTARHFPNVTTESVSPAIR